jgi:CubicO group peptidase (beta-lactamase class C family)
MDIVGYVAPGFGAVADAVSSVGPGVEVAAYVRGQAMVDVRTDDLPEDALICTWSAIKPVTGTCLLLLVERGQVSLDQPVVEVWPGIKDPRLLVRHLLTHTAGRVSVPAVPLTDWDASIAALAAADPDWAPGEVICEHAQTFGHLVGEVVRRVDGRSVGTYLAEEISAPLGIDVRIGVGPDEQARVPDTVGLDPAWWDAQRGEPGSARYRATGDYQDVNEWVWRRAELPAVNGFATAVGMAEFWQAYLDGRLPEGVGTEGVTGFDLFTEETTTWTLAGGIIDGPNVGMAGLGGQWAAARPDDELAWAFLTTHVGDHDRADQVEAAILRCL